MLWNGKKSSEPRVWHTSVSSSCSCLSLGRCLFYYLQSSATEFLASGRKIPANAHNSTCIGQHNIETVKISNCRGGKRKQRLPLFKSMNKDHMTWDITMPMLLILEQQLDCHKNFQSLRYLLTGIRRKQNSFIFSTVIVKHKKHYKQSWWTNGMWIILESQKHVDHIMF